MSKHVAHGGDQSQNIWISRSIDFPDRDLLSDRDSVFSGENSFEIWGLPVRTCLVCTGTPVETCRKFWQS